MPQLPPRRTSRSAATPTRGKPQSRSLTAIIAAVVLVVLSVAAGVAVIQLRPLWSRWLEPEAPLDLRWLPTEADLVIWMRPARLHSTPLAETYRDSALYPRSLNAPWPGTTLTAQETESVLIGVVGLIAPERHEAPPQLQFHKHLIVVRARTNVEDPKAVGSIARVDRAIENQQRYFRLIPKDQRQPVIAAWLPEPKTMVLGEEQLVRHAIVRGDQVERRPELDGIDPQNELALAIVPLVPKTFDQVRHALAGTPLESLSEITTRETTGVILSARVDDDIRFDAAFSVTSPEQAAILKSQIDDLVSRGRETTAASSDHRTWKRLFLLADQTLRTIETNNSGHIATLSGSVPDTLMFIVEDSKVADSHAILGGLLAWMLGEFSARGFPWSWLENGSGPIAVPEPSDPEMSNADEVEPSLPETQPSPKE